MTIYNKIIQYMIPSIIFNMKRNQMTTRPFKAVFYFSTGVQFEKATMYVNSLTYKTLIGLKKFASQDPTDATLMRLGKLADRERISEINWNVFLKLQTNSIITEFACSLKPID
ncbi:hypothetical protein AB4X15_20740 [Peribacillus simplex]|uniref:hypothetical protein n=2 Tax=Peribacillus TaxID=2675229 RepID=UPI0034E8BA60